MGEKTKKASSPGQIFLFGEHAVVYGYTALATAIDMRTEVQAELVDNEKLEIKSREIGELKGKIEEVNGKWSIKKKSGDLEKLRFVIKIIQLTLNHIDRAKGLKIYIKSDLPPGSGLGSSSAVTTATAAAVSSVLGKDLTKKEISDLAFNSELEVQGAASRTGVNVATYGGFLKIRRSEKKALELPQLKILIGYTGEYSNTGKLVGDVKNLKEARPNITNPILEAIGKAAESGIESLQKEHLEKVGVLMNANQALLRGLNVSSSKLHNLIQAARSTGAIGAKLTGAGGGGCMIALSRGNIDGIAESVKRAGGEPMKAKIGAEGLKIDP
ncbi:hypothetical protein AKJ63_01000 [candidate division MSBL1 archaeon SCGC-AAA259D18]|uniref:Mevalonate kinase n=2 Tax=candidate division MSBL1 TaxID=215777 RepID=A0A133UBH1_9EURY|nr:hypothetical protein AKJ57_00845 [candidate division MSBL1 archaeon SCGC-AAA259A05]KXA91775.1 hypothetical protein AKJ63_01000 [candidate division MSBL1 archaeon SCGC-AAA259D18]